MISRNPASRRHALLFAAVFFLLIGAFLDPRILHRLACHAGIITVAFLVVCAFLAAKGVGRLADAFLRKPISPWYARPGVVIFLCIIVPCMNVAFLTIDGLFINVTQVAIISQQVRMFAFMSLELLWIALLE